MWVKFWKQGHHQAVGEAIGRMGKQILCSYHIQSGEHRERWIAGNRIIELEGDINELPRWKRKTCKASPLPNIPVIVERVSEDVTHTLPPAGIDLKCPDCGERRDFDTNVDQQWAARNEVQNLVLDSFGPCPDGMGDEGLAARGAWNDLARPFIKAAEARMVPAPVWISIKSHSAIVEVAP